MTEITLAWPNVELCYMDRGGSWPGLQVFPEIEKGQYGYRLTAGQQLHSIRYRGTNYDIFVNPKVEEIQEDGLLVTHLLQNRDEGAVLCPWQKSLPSGGVYKTRDLYVVPCEPLYEKNRLADVLAGNIREEELRPPGLQDVVRPERGIFWKHGGWRNPGDRISRENLKNFVKLGQQEIF